MDKYLMLWTFAGWCSFWVIRIPNTVFGPSPINTIADFFRVNWKQFIFSVAGLLFLITGADTIPGMAGAITGPYTAIVAGGSIPSMIMETLAFLNRKNTDNESI